MNFRRYNNYSSANRSRFNRSTPPKSGNSYYSSVNGPQTNFNRATPKGSYASSNDSKWQKPPVKFDRKNDFVPPYSSLPLEKLPKNLHSIKISGLPNHLSEKGLFHFFHCFGHIVNVYFPEVKPSTGETPAKNDDNKTFVALISYKRYFPAVEAKRMNGRSVFGHRIHVELINDDKKKRSRPAASDQKPEWKKKNLMKLPEEVILKIFGQLDFASRVVAESVCRSWRSFLGKNEEKLSPADDRPKNVKLALLKNTSPDIKETTIKFDKASNGITIYLAPKRGTSLRMDVRNRLNKILPKLQLNVDEVSFSNLEIDLQILILIDKYCSPTCRIALDRVSAYEMPLHFYALFCRRYGDRLQIVDENEQKE